MGRLRVLRSSEVIRALESLGFQIVQQRGSHVRMRHTDQRVVTVPIHSGQDIGRGMLRKIVRDAMPTPQEISTAVQN